MINLIFSHIGSFCSIVGIGFALSITGKSSAAKFQSFKDKGVRMKESKRLGKAILYYKKALDYAETDEQKSQIWFLIIHIHTDRLIKASENFRGCTGYVPEWRFGPNNIPTNYEPPLTKEALR